MPQTTYEFNTTLYQNLPKVAEDIRFFLDTLPNDGANIVRWNIDGRNLTSGTIRITLDKEPSAEALIGLQVTRVPGAQPVYEMTTRWLADFVRGADDVRFFIDSINTENIGIVSISIDGRTLTNGVVRITTSDTLKVTSIIGFDIARV